ncbi:alanine racemase [Pelomonas sp. CA6]|uniref:alanine racemase n=1 Tax=Pelomonas sp. CA6 TaxID=2907999 RepID=UPI001F4BFA8A|nr:alanine racemase [Pelomonas sp. CA6]MCH7344587.1 alanine racemase [Pelomonas sp. CA6]
MSTTTPPRRASRRRLLLAGTGVLALGAWAARPSDRGAPHDDYFQALSRALREAGLAQPVLVVDRARLRGNLAVIAGHCQRNGVALRAVLKSLPSLALMDELASAWHSERVMAFNAEQTRQMLEARPQRQLLLGKPLPAAAAARLLRELPAERRQRVEWLVDTPERLDQYRQLAQQQGQVLRINLEIDVGLHRGGFDPEDEARLGPALQALRAGDGPRLAFSGFMGYDAHLAALPEVAGLRERALAASLARYRQAWLLARHRLGPLARETLTLNTAGSPTYRWHDASGTANEVAVGSAALLPSDFDKPQLADLQPAAFIATPVLKTWPRFSLPDGLGAISDLQALWDPNARRGVAMHGGHWLADIVSPAGLAPSGLWGHSSNQQMLAGSAATGLKADDWIFLRPRQSEALLLQFGDLQVYDGGHIATRWPVLPASA